MPAAIAKPEAPVVGYIVSHRAPGPRSRWRRVGEARTHAAAVALFDGPGDWHAAPIRNPALLKPETLKPKTVQPTLFD